MSSKFPVLPVKFLQAGCDLILAITNPNGVYFEHPARESRLFRGKTNFDRWLCFNERLKTHWYESGWRVWARYTSCVQRRTLKANQVATTRRPIGCRLHRVAANCDTLAEFTFGPYENDGASTQACKFAVTFMKNNYTFRCCVWIAIRMLIWTWRPPSVVLWMCSRWSIQRMNLHFAN